MQDIRGKTVYVGLSGGVDSAVSAALLQHEGAKVTGVFIKGWYPPGMPCTWAEDRRDAMRVAARLHIPFVTLDASREYKESVIDYLMREYRAGRTPNPDIMCNRDVKFGVFYRYALEAGADAIATGHYRSGAKDQSYFLWAVPKETLTKTIFPLAGLEKPAVRTLAKRFGLPVAEKSDSQGVCFLGPISVDEFLTREFGTHFGRAIDEKGGVVGKHRGALLYTLGERVSLQEAVPGPWFVIAKNLETNELVVSHERMSRAQTTSKLLFATPNWHGEPEEVAFAQYRYRGPMVPGHVDGESFVPTEALSEPAAAGQSLVFYDTNKNLLGGALLA
jgi:tRNA-specific 2-thiouridylase